MFEHVTTIEQLIEVAHQMAVDKGWWPGGPDGRSVVEQVNNFHAEIAEAWEEWRAGRLELWWSVDGQPTDETCERHIHKAAANATNATPKPEGFWVEIADIVIRLCDSAGAYGWALSHAMDRPYLSIPFFVKRLRRLANRLECETSDDWSDEADETASKMVCVGFATANESGVDLWTMIRLKLAYNATREHRHGGKRA